MLGFIVRRSIMLIPILFLISIVSFVIIELPPGNFMHIQIMQLRMSGVAIDDIFDDPKHPYTQALWRSIPRIDGPLEELVPITGNVPSPFAVQRGCPFSTRCPQCIPGVCDERRPPEIEVGPNHTVRCFLYTDDHQTLADEGGAEGP